MRLETIKRFVLSVLAVAATAVSGQALAAAPQVSPASDVKFSATPLDGYDCAPQTVNAPAAKKAHAVHVAPHHMKKAVAAQPAAPLTAEQKIVRAMKRIDAQSRRDSEAIKNAYNPPVPKAPEASLSQVASTLFKCVRAIPGIMPAMLPKVGGGTLVNGPQPHVSYPPSVGGGYGSSPPSTNGIPSYLTPQPSVGSGGGAYSPSGPGYYAPSSGPSPVVVFPPSITGGGGGKPSVAPVTPVAPVPVVPPSGGHKEPKPDYCQFEGKGFTDTTGSCGPKPPPVVQPPVLPPKGPVPDDCAGLVGDPVLTPHIYAKCGPGVKPPPPPEKNCLTDPTLPQCQVPHQVPEPSSGALVAVAALAVGALQLRKNPPLAAKNAVAAFRKFKPF